MRKNQSLVRYHRQLFFFIKSVQSISSKQNFSKLSKRAFAEAINILKEFDGNEFELLKISEFFLNYKSFVIYCWN